ncbi:MAG TPA: serine hydrolase domain-containing protein [Longimicrobiales bacterium]|nr:serine hydrolase domain-containing protein [Longimicrobiales bacterium]
MTSHARCSATVLGLFLLPATLLAPASELAAQDPDALHARVDSLFVAYNRTDSPGCALGVYRDGAIAYARGYGMADLEQGVAIGAHTVFDIGSTSKQFTAAALALLEQDGLLSLDDDVREHVPELPDYGRPITIRHLLNHTSGLRDYIGLMTMAGTDIDDVTGDDEALAAIARQHALNFEPGAEWLYSNSGYFLASVIVERVSGRTLPEFARERIFAPLGMRSTLFRDDYRLVIPQRASAYAPEGDGTYAIDMSNWQQTGDGAVFTTVEDLLLWDRNFYEPRVGGRALLDALHTRGRLSSGDTLEYALGLFIDEYRGARTVSHGGSWGGYRAELLRFPDERVSVAVLCNLATTDPSTLAQRVADVYLADRLRAADGAVATSHAEHRAVTMSTAQLRRWTGTYQDSASGEVRRVVMRDSVLMLEAFGREWPLVPIADDEFRADVPVDLTFRFDAGPPVRLHQNLQGSSTTFRAIETVSPGVAELRAYAGRFRSDELDATYEVRLEDDALQLVMPGSSPSRTLRPLQRDSFQAGTMVIRFQRSGGRISGFLLDQGRVRGLVFQRTAQ